MDFVTAVKLNIYNTIADTGRVPTAYQVAEAMNQRPVVIEAAFKDLAGQRLLVLEPGDPGRIRMAPPFSGIETDHKVVSGGTSYYANCAWDAFGIPAALHQDVEIESVCADCGQQMAFKIRNNRPVLPQNRPTEAIVHFAVPAVHWWDDIIYT